MFNAVVLLLVKLLQRLMFGLAFSFSTDKTVYEAQVAAFSAVKLAFSEVPQAIKPKRTRFIYPFPRGWSQEPNATLYIHAKRFDSSLTAGNQLTSSFSGTLHFIPEQQRTESSSTFFMI